MVFTTRNRKAELDRALQSVMTQDIPLEVLVMDDGSEDGTHELVAARYPGVKLHRSVAHRGLTWQRNLAARLATTEFLISLDDDGVFSTPRVVRQSLADFDHPRIGAVAIPYIDCNYNTLLLQAARGAGGIDLTSVFAGTAVAFRRAVFQQVGGYRDLYFRQNEETDFALRLFDHGYVIRRGRADPVHHFESSVRDIRLNAHLCCRNHLLFSWLNVPGGWFLYQMTGATLYGFYDGLRRGHPLSRLVSGTVDGYRQILLQRHDRQPVSFRAYTLFRRLLPNKSILRLEDVEHRLPPLRVPPAPPP